MAKRRILISCGGLGMGNASRVFAIAQAAARLWPDCEVHFFSWGKGAEFLKQAMSRRGDSRFHLECLEEFVWSGKAGIPVARFLQILGTFAWAYWKNSLTLARACRELRPEVILLDSDYHFPAFFFRRGKLCYLGQAIDVVERAKSVSFRKGWTSRLSFFVCEVIDSVVQRIFSDRVFVPSFLETELTGDPGERVLRVPLIVREEFLAPGNEPQGSRVSAVFSGSGIERERMHEIAGSLGVPADRRFDSAGITTPEYYREADLVLIQGGLSSISECIALRRKMLIVPIRGRAEQEVNARTVARLGLGAAVEDEDQFRLEELPTGTEAGSRVLVHGAEVVARHLLP